MLALSWSIMRPLGWSLWHTCWSVNIHKPHRCWVGCQKWGREGKVLKRGVNGGPERRSKNATASEDAEHPELQQQVQQNKQGPRKIGQGGGRAGTGRGSQGGAGAGKEPFRQRARKRPPAATSKREGTACLEELPRLDADFRGRLPSEAVPSRVHHPQSQPQKNVERFATVALTLQLCFPLMATNKQHIRCTALPDITAVVVCGDNRVLSDTDFFVRGWERPLKKKLLSSITPDKPTTADLLHL